MATPIQVPPLTEFRKLEDTSKTMILWQAYQDTWAKLAETITHQKQIEASTIVLEKLLIKGDPDENEPSVLERLRVMEGFIKGFKYWVSFIIGAILLQTIAFGWAVFLAVVRFLPALEKIASKP